MKRGMPSRVLSPFVLFVSFVVPSSYSGLASASDGNKVEPEQMEVPEGSTTKDTKSTKDGT